MESVALKKILCSIGDQEDSDTVLESKTQIKTEKPPLYKVLLLNDDYTPMEFVIKLLVEVFHKSIEQSKKITLDIHEQGQAGVGYYNLEIADQKTTEGTVMARKAGHPLRIKVVKVQW